MLAGAAPHLEAGRERARYVLERGHGLEKFREFVAAQGGDSTVADDPAAVLPSAPLVQQVHAAAAGWLAAVDAEAVGWAAAALGAGRQRRDDPVDPGVAIELPTKIGDQVAAGQPLATIRARSEADADQAAAALRAALSWSDQPPPVPPLLHQLIGP